MKKILILLTLLIPFTFSINVNAEGITDDVKNSIISYLEDNYTTDQLSRLVVAYESSNVITAYVVKSEGYFYIAPYYLSVYFTDSDSPRYIDIIRFNNQGVYSSTVKDVAHTGVVANLNGKFGTTNFDESLIYIVSSPIYSDQEKTSILYDKNYPIEEEPTLPPEEGGDETENTDNCNSFVCNISSQVLDDFDVEGFTFLETIINFLIILLFDLIIVSPFILIFKIARWL